MTADRDAIIETLRHPVWSDAGDRELAAYLGVTEREVREARADLTRRLYTAEVLAALARLRAATESELADAELLLVALELALALHTPEPAEVSRAA